MSSNHPFALCLTHDVDRPYKTYQAPYYAVKDRDLSQLATMVTSESPYWQFEEIMALEDELGVRSSFYFLNEQRLFADRPISEWIRPKSWKLFRGRYDVTDEEIKKVIHTLDENGWEVGLHGSYHSYLDVERLEEEKDTLEGILGHSVLGGRQHYLNVRPPETWRHHVEIGLRYDTTYPSRHHDLFRPFDDEFVVFPLTLMDRTLTASQPDMDACWDTCEDVLREASRNDRVVTVCWHPRYFNDEEFPGYTELYVRLIERAWELDAWIGPCGDFYTEFLRDES